mmetsp:Transcript_123336/g.354368  ORF Transcript_123336/g.354368 Transcript_123336/m.354368 type:complete len:126 (+) Transcript_123336:51-428(+)
MIIHRVMKTKRRIVGWRCNLSGLWVWKNWPFLTIPINFRIYRGHLALQDDREDQIFTSTRLTMPSHMGRVVKTIMFWKNRAIPVLQKLSVEKIPSLNYSLYRYMAIGRIGIISLSSQRKLSRQKF